MAYPTLAEFKSYLGVSDTTEDTLLTALLDAAKSDVERYCGRTFVAGSASRLFPVAAPWVQGRRRLTFFEDLASISSLTNGDGQVIGAAEYDLMPVRGAPYYGLVIQEESAYRFDTDGAGTPITVAGSWGYAAACPKAVWLLIQELAATFYRARSMGMMGVVAVAGRSGAVSSPATIPEAIQIRLDAWRRWGP